MDGLSLSLILAAMAVGALSLLLTRSPGSGRVTCHLILLLIAAAGLMVMDDVVLLFCAWELVAFGAWFLIVWRRAERRELDQSWHASLAMIGGAASLATGLILLQQTTTTYSIGEMTAYAAGAVQIDTMYLPVLVLILVGLFAPSAAIFSRARAKIAAPARLPGRALTATGLITICGAFVLARLDPVLGQTGVWWGLFVGLMTFTSIVGAFGWRRMRMALADVLSPCRSDAADEPAPSASNPSFMTGVRRAVSSQLFPFYLLLILIPAIGIVAMPLLTQGQWSVPWDGLPLNLADVLVGALVLVVAIFSVLAASRPTGLVATGATGLGIALILGVAHERQLAMMMLLAETCFVLLLMVLLPRLPRLPPLAGRPMIARGAMAMVTLTCLIGAARLAQWPEPPAPYSDAVFARADLTPRPHGAMRPALPPSIQFGRLTAATPFAGDEARHGPALVVPAMPHGEPAPQFASNIAEP